MTITAKSVMSKDLVTVSPATTLVEADRRMVARGVSAVAVVDSEGRPVGVVSEGDVIRIFGKESQNRRAQWLRILAEGEPLAQEFLAAIALDQRPVRDFMRAPVVSAGVEASLADLADLMRKHEIKRVLILHEGKLVGIVSRADVLRTVVGHLESLLEPVE